MGRYFEVLGISKGIILTILIAIILGIIGISCNNKN